MVKTLYTLGIVLGELILLGVYFGGVVWTCYSWARGTLPTEWALLLFSVMNIYARLRMVTSQLEAQGKASERSNL